MIFTRNVRPGVLGTTIRTGTRNVYRPVLLNGSRHVRGLTGRLSLDLRNVRVVGLHRSHRTRHHRHCTGVLTRGGTHRNCAIRRTGSGVFRHGCFNVVVIRANRTSTFVANLCAGCSGAVGITGRIVNVQGRCGRFKAVRVIGAGGKAFFLTSALVGHRPSARAVVSVTHLTSRAIHFFGHRPIVTVLSCSGFNSSPYKDPTDVRGTIRCVRRGCPRLTVSNRVRIGFTVGGGLHSHGCPFAHLRKGRIGALMFPGLDSTGTNCRLLRTAGNSSVRVVNPVRVKLGGPVRFASFRDSIQSVIGVATMTIVSTVIVGGGTGTWRSSFLWGRHDPLEGAGSYTILCVQLRDFSYYSS